MRDGPEAGLALIDTRSAVSEPSHPCRTPAREGRTVRDTPCRGPHRNDPRERTAARRSLSEFKMTKTRANWGRDPHEDALTRFP